MILLHILTVQPLYHIRALKDFGDVNKGDLGGYIEKEENLSQYDDCWAYNNAEIFGNARVTNNARIYDYAKIYGYATISENARIYDYAIVHGVARVNGDAKVYFNSDIYSDTIIANNAYICDTNDYITIGPIGSRNDYTTFYSTEDKNIMVKCGCFNDTIEEFVKAVYETHKDNKKYKNQYDTAINCAKILLK